jgi:hypothetical protein
VFRADQSAFILTIVADRQTYAGCGWLLQQLTCSLCTCWQEAGSVLCCCCSRVRKTSYQTACRAATTETNSVTLQIRNIAFNVINRTCVVWLQEPAESPARTGKLATMVAQAKEFYRATPVSFRRAKVLLDLPSFFSKLHKDEYRLKQARLLLMHRACKTGGLLAYTTRGRPVPSPHVRTGPVAYGTRIVQIWVQRQQMCWMIRLILQMVLEQYCRLKFSCHWFAKGIDAQGTLNKYKHALHGCLQAAFLGHRCPVR